MAEQLSHSVAALNSTQTRGEAGALHSSCAFSGNLFYSLSKRIKRTDGSSIPNQSYSV